VNELKQYVFFGEEIHTVTLDKISRTCSFQCATYNKHGYPHTVHKSNKPEKVRYVILGNKYPESEFKEPKTSFKSVQWVHMKDGTFVWRDSNCGIDTICKYNDYTKCEPYDVKNNNGIS
jgi:hypothetical protein